MKKASLNVILYQTLETKQKISFVKDDWKTTTTTTTTQLTIESQNYGVTFIEQ